MKLMTKAIETQLLKIAQGSTDKPGKHPIIVKFFNPTGSGTWYAIEGRKLESDTPNDWLFFGLADILEPELGYFQLSELKSFKGRFGLGIERDLHFSGFLDTTSFPVKVVR
jgi:hypothetical protein